MFFRYLSIVLLLIFSISACSFAEEKKDHQQTKQNFNIPMDIKLLLKKEMLAVEKGMQQLLSAIATGNWHKTTEIAKHIQASYIMKQQLTAEQKNRLHHHLPAQFIKLDQLFHQYAGKLAQAAELKDTDVVNFYFYKMTDSCVQCHSRYAKEVFPGFLSRKQSTHQH
ncbi:MAG: cytochrome c [Methylococcales bacterium]|nr:cytochrome c [Methylococcales bacterium]